MMHTSWMIFEMHYGWVTLRVQRDLLVFLLSPLSQYSGLPENLVAGGPRPNTSRASGSVLECDNMSRKPPLWMFKMQVYTYSEARQKLAIVLEQAEDTGKVLIRRKDGRTFALVP